MLSAQKGRVNALLKHNPVSICITIRLHILLLLLFFCFSASQQLSVPPPRLDSGRAAAEPFCSHTHFHVIPTCRRAQNCQTLSTALDAMCNSFNTRPCRYPYHWCNGVLMPPCIPRACTRQLVIRLIYSTRPAEDRAALALCCAGHSAAFVLRRWSQGHMWFYHRPEKTSFMTSYLQPGSLISWGTNVGTLGGEKSLDEKLIYEKVIKVKKKKR